MYVCIYIYTQIFFATTPYDEQRLASCGYNEKLTYQQQGENIENIKNIGKNRKLNIWFNPPYSKSLKRNIGKYFFRLLRKHFKAQLLLHTKSKSKN